MVRGILKDGRGNDIMKSAKQRVRDRRATKKKFKTSDRYD